MKKKKIKREEKFLREKESESLVGFWTFGLGVGLEKWGLGLGLV